MKSLLIGGILAIPIMILVFDIPVRSVAITLGALALFIIAAIASAARPKLRK